MAFETPGMEAVHAKLAALWWWPEQSAEFIAKRGEYADKYKAS